MFFLFSDLRLQAAVVGETAHLLCRDDGVLRRSVNWRRQRQSDTVSHQIISGGNLTNGDSVARLSTNGSMMIIDKVQSIDSGVYVCIENTGLGTQHYIFLSVHGKHR